MFTIIVMVLRSLFSLQTSVSMKAEIIALRHQVIVLKRTQRTKRLMLRPADRWLWVYLSRVWTGWRSALLVVKPETVVSWYRKALRHTIRAYIGYYHRSRLHLSLDRDSPDPRPVQSIGAVIEIPEVGGLHHRYERRAA